MPDRLFTTSVPGAWRPLLDTLADIEAAAHDESTPQDERRGRLAELRGAMLAELESLHDDSKPPAPPWLVERFCQAVLLWSYYSESGARVRFSTQTSQTLPHFELDLPDGPTHRQTLKAALQRTFELDPVDLERWQTEIEHQSSNLSLKRAITRLVVARLQRHPGQVHNEIVRLFQSIYGHWPFHPGDLQILVAEAGIVFIAPFRDGQLEVPGFTERAYLERKNLEGFLRIVEASAWKTDRFPGFGELDPEALDTGFLEELRRQLHSEEGLDLMPSSTVRDTLHTMVTFLAERDIEGYLIHDLWGHTWQETLGEFEWDYYRLESVLDRPIGWLTGAAPSPGHGHHPGREPQASDPDHDNGVHLGACFSVIDGTIELDRERAVAACRRELETRVVLSLNAVVAEALADITEYKYTHGERSGGERLPSSSLLFDSPIKHDLSARDILFHYRRWRGSFRALIDDPSERGRLSGQIAEKLGTHRGARQAVDALAELIRDALESTALSLHRSPKGGNDVNTPIQIDIMQRVQLAAARLDLALSRYLAQGNEALRRARNDNSDLPRWRCPLACLDLLVIFLGWVFEHDRAVRFWDLHRFIGDEVVHLMVRLGASLGSIPAQGETGT
ncbi:MAG: hypothetical protein AAFP04_14370 [Myxococcota bacterium]